MKIIKTYKGIELKYNEQDGRIYFGFEGVERHTAYVFEAEKIIDEPIWEDCNLEGYFIDGYFDKFIGKAKATRKNIKNGKPEWVLKGQYDSDYKKPNYSSNETKVFLRTEGNDDIYRQWETQREKFNEEMRILNNIVSKLS